MIDSEALQVTLLVPNLLDEIGIPYVIGVVILQAAYALNSRRTRYRGLTKTHLQNFVIAAVINLRRGTTGCQTRKRLRPQLPALRY